MCESGLEYGGKRLMMDSSPMRSPASTPAAGSGQGIETTGPRGSADGSLDLSQELKGKLSGVIDEGQLMHILSQLTNQIDAGPSPATQTQGAQGPKEPRIDPELIAKLAIAHKADGNKEIRIHLRNDALPNTQIIINRDANGLNISFKTGSEQANQLLNQNLSQIQKVLQHRLSKENVKVKVDYDEETDVSEEQEDEDPDYFIKGT